MSLIRGDALTIPLADNTVDLIVTSPPYFALRSYTDACGTCGGIEPPPPLHRNGTGKSGLNHAAVRKNPNPLGSTLQPVEPDPDCPECEGSGRGHYAGQLGSEATPAAFIDALISVTRECVRVLKPSGSMFVNLGDKYAGNQPHNGWPKNCRDPQSEQQSPEKDRQSRAAAVTNFGGIPTKSLMGLPWRYALRCIDDLGLILRAEIIWSKPNGLPESVQDRVRRSHEQWFHFTKEPRYYSAVDEIREAHARVYTARDYETLAGQVKDRTESHVNTYKNANTYHEGSEFTAANPLGKLPGSVWTIPTEPLQVPDDLPQHFAAFPSEWPRRIILGWSPSGICCECGEGRRPVAETSQEIRGYQERYTRSEARKLMANPGGGLTPAGYPVTTSSTVITGESCACPTPDAPTRPAVVLDPFAGTGTSVAVANHLGRLGVGIDLSADYLRLARWRCNDPGLRAKVLRVDKPAPEVPGQMALL